MGFSKEEKGSGGGKLAGREGLVCAWRRKKERQTRRKRMANRQRGGGQEKEEELNSTPLTTGEKGDRRLGRA